MMDNLKHWDRFADIDPKFTKGITGKDYSGTSPNAHYVIKCLTEMFGPVGEGFGWRVIAEQIDHFGDTAIHWCRIEFWHTDRANTFEAYGQTKMAYQTKSGFLKVDEDAPKKSLTDAITKAASQIGIAANIFLGRWDDNKYVAQVDAEYRSKERESQPRDPRKVADSLIINVRKATNYGHVNEIIGGAKFEAAWKWLQQEKPPMSNEVKSAINEMRNKFDPAGQAPDDRSAA